MYCSSYVTAEVNYKIPLSKNILYFLKSTISLFESRHKFIIKIKFISETSDENHSSTDDVIQANCFSNKSWKEERNDKDKNDNKISNEEKKWKDQKK